jgi:hypothetical protein
MRKRIVLLLSVAAAVSLLQMPGRAGEAPPPRWPAERANAWYQAQSWLVGCNFIPSTAINQLEMWQADTFDPETIDRELGWAEKIGFNTVRVFLHDLAWEADAPGFKKRIDKYLEIADKHRIRTLFVLFDDCWNEDPRIGKQRAPIPGVHNAGWVQSPSTAVVLDPKGWGRLERYVKDIIGSFGEDKRVLMWDLYNEPGNTKLGERSLPLVRATFGWARAAKPSQPLTAGLWFDNRKLNEYQLAQSDVITFHNYNKPDDLRRQIHELKKLGRPVICTEYMARTHGSTFAGSLLVFKNERVGCYNWGLVSGKTQTIYPWGSPRDAPEPQVWFHDIFRRDGRPFDRKEVEVIKAYTLNH